MTTVAVSTTPLGLRARARAWMAARADRAARRGVYRQTVRELEGMTHREMADLGLTRCDIHTLAYEAAYGVKPEDAR